MNKNIPSQIANKAFKEYSETLWIYLKKSNSKSSSYDPYRNTGYTKAYQNPISVKAIVHPLGANSLIVRELGLINSGSIEIIVKKNDANLVKIASKIEYENEEYSVFNKALGNKVQIVKKPFDFYKIVLFKVGK